MSNILAGLVEKKSKLMSRKRSLASNATSSGRKQLVSKSVRNFLSSSSRKNKHFVPHLRQGCAMYAPRFRLDSLSSSHATKFVEGIHSLLGRLMHAIVFAHPRIFVRCAKCDAVRSTMDGDAFTVRQMGFSAYRSAVPFCVECP